MNKFLKDGYIEIFDFVDKYFPKANRKSKRDSIYQKLNKSVIPDIWGKVGGGVVLNEEKCCIMLNIKYKPTN